MTCFVLLTYERVILVILKKYVLHILLIIFFYTLYINDNTIIYNL